MRYATSYPVLTGDPITQGHADYCTQHGHATYTQGGNVAPWCPRCGDNLPAEDVADLDKRTAYITADRDGRRAYVWAAGYAVVRDGYGRMAWSLYRPENHENGTPGYFSDTLTDARLNA